MTTNPIQYLRSQANKAWDIHFDECSTLGIWNKLDASLGDIKLFEISWKLRWIETTLKNTKETINLQKENEI